jgi:hypothetical protein
MDRILCLPATVIAFLIGSLTADPLLLRHLLLPFSLYQLFRFHAKGVSQLLLLIYKFGGIDAELVVWRSWRLGRGPSAARA